ncbi:MAG: hypothetical protein ABIK80_03215, partial [candidate division WOR-3 bacterium]
SGSYAYVADEDSGLRIIDISDPQNPQEVGYYDTPGEARGVYVSGSYVYIADCSVGLQIYQFYGTGINEKETLKGIKNLSFEGKKIYDISGKLVKEKKLKKGIYFKETEKGIKKILILK